MAVTSSGSATIDSPYMTGIIYADFSVTFSETNGSVSIPNNTSTVTYSGYANYDHSSNLGFNGTTRSEAGYFRVYVNGSLVHSTTCPLDSGAYVGYRLRTVSGTTSAITHNNDGSKTVECYAKIDAGNDPYGGGFVWDTTTGSKKSLTLTTIARASTPSINEWPLSSNTFVLDDTITIHMNRASSSFTHDVVFYYGNGNNRSTTVATGVTNNCTFDTSTISAQFLADNPSKSRLTGKIKVTTKNGSTTIGSKEITYTATIPDTYAPTLSNPDIHETELQTYGIADSVIVRYLSKKTVSIQATPKSYATISSVVAKSGTQSVPLILSNDTWTGTISNISTDSLELVATDSRGKTATHTFTGLTFVPYSYPTIINTTSLERTNASTGESEVHVDGTYWQGNAGNVTNKVRVKYKINTWNAYRILDFNDQAIVYSGSSYQLEETVTDPNGTQYNLDPLLAFSVDISVEDKFGQTVSLTLQLPSAHNALWVGKHTVRAHEYLIADTDVWLNDGATKLSSVASTVSSHSTQLTMRNYSWNGTFGESGSIDKKYQISGKGIVIFNIWAASGANQDDTGQIESWVELLNTSNASQGTLAWDGNRISVSASFRNATNSAGQWYYDGSSTSRRLGFHAKNTKMGTTSWCIRITTIGCTIAAV